VARFEPDLQAIARILGKKLCQRLIEPHPPHRVGHRGAPGVRDRQDIAALGQLSGVQQSLAETSYILARLLDRGAKGMGAAALTRELRATLDELMEARDRGDAATELISVLSSPLRDAAKRPAKSGRSRRGGGEAAGAGADALAARRTRRSARG
jgi:hypothetical protein